MATITARAVHHLAKTLESYSVSCVLPSSCAHTPHFSMHVAIRVKFIVELFRDGEMRLVQAAATSESSRIVARRLSCGGVCWPLGKQTLSIVRLGVEVVEHLACIAATPEMYASIFSMWSISPRRSSRTLRAAPIGLAVSTAAALPIATTKADFPKNHVRSTPESGHLQHNGACLLRAKSGHWLLIRSSHQRSVGDEAIIHRLALAKAGACL